MSNPSCSGFEQFEEYQQLFMNADIDDALLFDHLASIPPILPDLAQHFPDGIDFTNLLRSTPPAPTDTERNAGPKPTQIPFAAFSTLVSDNFVVTSDGKIVNLSTGGWCDGMELISNIVKRNPDPYKEMMAYNRIPPEDFPVPFPTSATQTEPTDPQAGFAPPTPKSPQFSAASTPTAYPYESTNRQTEFAPTSKPPQFSAAAPQTSYSSEAEPTNRQTGFAPTPQSPQFSAATPSTSYASERKPTNRQARFAPTPKPPQFSAATPPATYLSELQNGPTGFTPTPKPPQYSAATSYPAEPTPTIRQTGFAPTPKPTQFSTTARRTTYPSEPTNHRSGFEPKPNAGTMLPSTSRPKQGKRGKRLPPAIKPKPILLPPPGSIVSVTLAPGVQLTCLVAEDLQGDRKLISNVAAAQVNHFTKNGINMTPLQLPPLPSASQPKNIVQASKSSQPASPYGSNFAPAPAPGSTLPSSHDSHLTVPIAIAAGFGSRPAIPQHASAARPAAGTGSSFAVRPAGHPYGSIAPHAASSFATRPTAPRPQYAPARTTGSCASAARPAGPQQASTARPAGPHFAARHCGSNFASRPAGPLCASSAHSIGSKKSKYYVFIPVGSQYAPATCLAGFRFAAPPTGPQYAPTESKRARLSLQYDNFNNC